MNKLLVLSLLAPLFLAPGCSPQPSDAPVIPPVEKPKAPSWSMTGLLKDWLITPHDLTIKGQEIYVSGNLDNRVAVLDLNGQVLRYYVVEKKQEFDNVCVAVTSRGQVLALSSYGLWELKPDGTALKIKSLSLSSGHMIVGPDDNLYVSSRIQERSKIIKMGLDGSSSDLVMLDSNRISDLAFAPNGDLFLADGQFGQIYKYTPSQGVTKFSSGFPAPGGGPFYMDFDPAGRLYISSAWTHLAMVSADGTLHALPFINVSGDLLFHDGRLLVIDIYTAKMYEMSVQDTTIQWQRLLIDGVVPWHIVLQGETIVGQRGVPDGQAFFNYDIALPGRFEANPMLNALQPDQFAFDGSGSVYLLLRRWLVKLNPAGSEEYRVLLPSSPQWDTRIFHNAADGKIYYFDAAASIVYRVDALGAEAYHRFPATVSKAFLCITQQGQIYAAIISADGAKLVDISKSPEERFVWSPNLSDVVMMHIGADLKGKLYAALGPQFQHVFCIDPVKGTAVTMFGNSAARYDWSFVDIQGFAVTDSGTAVLSAPGVLIKFVPDA